MSHKLSTFEATLYNIIEDALTQSNNPWDVKHIVHTVTSESIYRYVVEHFDIVEFNPIMGFDAKAILQQEDIANITWSGKSDDVGTLTLYFTKGTWTNQRKPVEKIREWLKNIAEKYDVQLIDDTSAIVLC